MSYFVNFMELQTHLSLIDWQTVRLNQFLCICVFATFAVASCNFVCGLRFNYVRQRAVLELLCQVSEARGSARAREREGEGEERKEERESASKAEAAKAT